MLKTAWREKMKLTFKGMWQYLYNPNRLATTPPYHSDFCSCDSLYVSQILYVGKGRLSKNKGKVQNISPMSQIVWEDVQHKATLRQGPDTISQDHLPGVIPPCVCRHVARKLQYSWSWIQLLHDLREAAREAAQLDGCHNFCACQGLTERRAVPLTPSSVNLCWQVVVTHQDLTISCKSMLLEGCHHQHYQKMLASVFPGGDRQMGSSHSAPTGDPSWISRTGNQQGRTAANQNCAETWNTLLSSSSDFSSGLEQKSLWYRMLPTSNGPKTR